MSAWKRCGKRMTLNSLERHEPLKWGVGSRKTWSWLDTGRKVPQIRYLAHVVLLDEEETSRNVTLSQVTAHYTESRRPEEAELPLEHICPRRSLVRNIAKSPMRQDFEFVSSVQFLIISIQNCGGESLTWYLGTGNSIYLSQARIRFASSSQPYGWQEVPVHVYTRNRQISAPITISAIRSKIVWLEIWRILKSEPGNRMKEHHT